MRLIARETSFSFIASEERPRIQEVFRGVIEDEARNALIERDVLAALAQGRRCLILSQWKEHCQALARGLAAKGRAPFVLNGGMGKKERTAILQAIQATPRDQDLIVVATGQYLGEGFDCPQLDTLFLTFPASFKGKLVQYHGARHEGVSREDGRGSLRLRGRPGPGSQAHVRASGQDLQGAGHRGGRVK